MRRILSSTQEQCFLVSPAHAAPPLNAISLHSPGYSTRPLSLILIVWNPALVELVMASNVYSNYLSGKGLSTTRAWPCVTGYAAEVYRKFRYYDFYRSSCQFKGRRMKFHVILYILIKSGREYLKEVSELFLNGQLGITYYGQRFGKFWSIM